MVSLDLGCFATLRVYWSTRHTPSRGNWCPHDLALLTEIGGSMADIHQVGVVGCGLMGAGIAEVCARAGRDVVVVEKDQMAVDAGSKRLETSIRKIGRASCRERVESVGRAAECRRNERNVHGRRGRFELGLKSG